MTQNHIQGVLGEFQPVLDRAGGEFTQNQVQGVLGEFKPVLDPAQTAVEEYEANDERNIELSGISTLTNERSIELRGKSESNSERNLELNSKASLSSERGFESHGIGSLESERGFELEGESAIEEVKDERIIELTGKSSLISERNIELRGKRSTNDAIGGSCLKFDGEDDYVEVIDDASLNFGTGEFSVEGWIRPNSLANAPGIIAKLDVENEKGYEIYGLPNLDRLAFWITDGINFFAVYTPGIDLGRWHHLVAIKRDSKIELYLNGELVDDADILGIGSMDNDRSLFFGTDEWVSPFSGLIDEVRIYSRALSAEEVAEHYQEIFKNKAGLVGKWRMNEGTGEIAYDTSGQGNDGTLKPNYPSNSPTWVDENILQVSVDVEFAGKIFIDSEREVELQGMGVTQNERNFETAGKSEGQSEREIELSGIERLTSERAFELMPVGSEASERQFELAGIFRGTNEREMELKGWLPETSERRFEMRVIARMPYCPKPNPFSPKESPYSPKTSPFSEKESPYVVMANPYNKLKPAVCH